jgi:hypothetical protein
LTDLIENASASSPLSIVEDSPYEYFDFGGTGYVFDPNKLWDSDQRGDIPPNATIFSGNLSVALQVTRQPGRACENLAPTIFGIPSNFSQWIHNFSDNCYLVGNISFTAGVTTSRLSTYLSSRVVEDQTPLNHVVFEPSPWVQESLWLLPDLMTMAATMNSSQLPTWDNIDGYIETLTRQCYLAAWGMYKASFDGESLVYNAIAQEPRIQATVSFGRVFGWLVICLSMTAGGVYLLQLEFSNNGYTKVSPDGGEESLAEAPKGPDVTEEDLRDSIKEVVKDPKGIIDDLYNAGFFSFF